MLGKDVYSKPITDADRVKIKKALKGVKVEVTYRGRFRRKYRITGVTSQPTRELLYVIVIFSVNFTYLSFEEMIFAFPPNRFPLDEKMNMQSIVDYFQEMYRYTIMRPHLPCIQVGSEKKTNYLPMETIHQNDMILILMQRSLVSVQTTSLHQLRLELFLLHG
ncbi:protein argonaute [Trifolium repens]|nr:protein argonaute [Trifolium repens]